MDRKPEEVSGDISVSAAQAARDLRVTVSRLRRRIREVARDDDLTPPQVSALTLVGKHGAATASALASAEGSARSRWPPRSRPWNSRDSSGGAPTRATDGVSW